MLGLIFVWKIARQFPIEPSVDFDFIAPAQVPDLIFDLCDFHLL